MKRPPWAAIKNPIRLRLVVAAGSEIGTDFCHGSAMTDIQ